MRVSSSLSSLLSSQGFLFDTNTLRMMASYKSQSSKSGGSSGRRSPMTNAQDGQQASLRESRGDRSQKYRNLRANVLAGLTPPSSGNGGGSSPTTISGNGGSHSGTAGNDVATVSGNNNTYNTGNGTNTTTVTGNNNTITGGSDNDSFTIGATATGNTISGGSGGTNTVNYGTVALNSISVTNNNNGTLTITAGGYSNTFANITSFSFNGTTKTYNEVLSLAVEQTNVVSGLTTDTLDNNANSYGANEIGAGAAGKYIHTMGGNDSTWLYASNMVVDHGDGDDGAWARFFGGYDGTNPTNATYVGGNGTDSLVLVGSDADLQSTIRVTKVNDATYGLMYKLTNASTGGHIFINDDWESFRMSGSGTVYDMADFANAVDNNNGVLVNI